MTGNGAGDKGEGDKGEGDKGEGDKRGVEQKFTKQNLYRSIINDTETKLATCRAMTSYLARDMENTLLKLVVQSIFGHICAAEVELMALKRKGFQ